MWSSETGEWCRERLINFARPPYPRDLEDTSPTEAAKSLPLEGTCVECLTLGKSFVPTLYGEGYPEDLKLGYGLSCAVRYWMSSVSRATPANIAAVVAAGSSEKRGEPEGPVWE